MKILLVLTVLFATSVLADLVPRYVVMPTIEDELSSLTNDESSSLTNDESSSLTNDESSSLTNDESSSLTNDESSSLTDAEGRITNGQSASSGQFPYQVGLMLALSSYSSTWCGGSLIDSQWVLTAAHCVDGVKSATVYLGATNRNKPALTLSVRKSALYKNSKYNSRTVQNDIALIKLPYPVRLTSKIQTIDLATSSKSSASGDEAIVSGWGLVSDKSSTVSNSLNYAILTIAPDSTCSRIYGRSVFTSKNICAKTVNSVSTCQGDSGGPLVNIEENVQIGIVSYGSDQGCEFGYPVAFTKVSSFIDWINEKSGLKF